MSDSSTTASTVETRFQVIATADDPFVFADGKSLDNVTLAYETYGEISEAKDNVILLFHALSGNQHAAGHNTGHPDIPYWTLECYAGWWEDFIGPNKALDTNKFHVICVNYIGGCYGSTGPATINPETEKPYASAFPHISVSDVVRSQILLLDRLGIGRLHAVVGPSTGGLAAINLATTFPERTSRVIPIATGVKTTVLNRIFLLEQILSIENDPHFQGGEYYESQPPELGLRLSRMISHKCFVHLDAIERRANKEVIQPEDSFAWYKAHDHVESYMLHQGRKFTARFDANTYIRICEMWSRFDPVVEGKVADSLELFKRSKDAGHRYLVFTIDEDYCFYPEEQANLVSQLKAVGISPLYFTVHTDKGHDSFLLQPALYAPQIQALLNS